MGLLVRRFLNGGESDIVKVSKGKDTKGISFRKIAGLLAVSTPDSAAYFFGHDNSQYNTQNLDLNAWRVGILNGLNNAMDVFGEYLNGSKNYDYNLSNISPVVTKENYNKWANALDLIGAMYNDDTKRALMISILNGDDLQSLYQAILHTARNISRPDYDFQNNTWNSANKRYNLGRDTVNGASTMAWELRGFDESITNNMLYNGYTKAGFNESRDTVMPRLTKALKLNSRSDRPIYAKNGKYYLYVNDGGRNYIIESDGQGNYKLLDPGDNNWGESGGSRMYKDWTQGSYNLQRLGYKIAKQITAVNPEERYVNNQTLGRLSTNQTTSLNVPAAKINQLNTRKYTSFNKYGGKLLRHI